MTASVIRLADHRKPSSYPVPAVIPYEQAQRLDIGIPPMHPWLRNALWFGAGVLTCYLALR
jgi:hypothetical protein